MDASLDWIQNYRSQYNIVVPLLHHANSAFIRYRVGGQFGAWPPVHIIIDKSGIIRWRSIGNYSLIMDDAQRLIKELLNEN